MIYSRSQRPEIRRSQRVLLMVHELHKLGYQRLRICPGMKNFWRCSITHIGNILKKHGAMSRDYAKESAYYSSADENVFFGWEDAKQDTARQLAAKFIERFPELCQQGKGRDWAYAGWYVEMLGFAEREELPVSYDEWHDEQPDPEWLPTDKNVKSRLPMPPGGEAEEDGKRETD